MNINTGQLKPENTKGKMADAFDVGSEMTEDSTDCVFFVWWERMQIYSIVLRSHC